jgi:hypothetical protein
MADTNVHAEAVFPVRSRVSWGAIFAGAFVALALYILLSLFGAAVGFSVSDWTRGEQLGTGAATWAVFSTLVSLFVGGWVTSQCTVGENKMEAAVYGVILWGMLFTGVLTLAAAGLQLGLSGIVSMATANREAGRPLTSTDIEAAGHALGMSQADIDKYKADPNSPEAREKVADAVRANAHAALWWAFAGTLLSMAAAVLGSLAGSGPTPILRVITIRSRGVQTGTTVGVSR